MLAKVNTINFSIRAVQSRHTIGIVAFTFVVYFYFFQIYEKWHAFKIFAVSFAANFVLDSD